MNAGISHTNGIQENCQEQGRDRGDRGDGGDGASDSDD
jgi:hypothetical protein